MIASTTGLQKDRDNGTAGPKEGFSPIGRFGLKGQNCCQLFLINLLEGPIMSDTPRKGE